MASFYTIANDKGTYISNVEIKINGLRGSVIKTTNFDRFDSKKESPLFYISLEEADRVMEFLRYFFTDVVDGCEVVMVTVFAEGNDGKLHEINLDDVEDRKITYKVSKIERPKPGLTDDETGKPEKPVKKKGR